ncbi:LLM class flavin-dependent oxidoreductase [Lactobacillus paracasei]|uniref:LLM class flavin-dependent oxidoreductase n=1 Tax=Lacticaseibacillus paracasei TaxID=1597 RepID=UPI000D37D2B8|nr:LLM class flavin-dependent oxidoreductase [Lacticaseibacillus paracasei]PTS57128.1 LLM class flavin-dependent oxidoreductase [Lactobacillus sp. DS22_6]MBS6630422.1 LLM class flavin-dependent oxidoreductase [Lacticaseibacillus paracasei]MBX4165126.1 LLM class flavin-dependent oxidoreductase [Lacticaseibacillus paracasei]MCZ2751524.1 LLM class flavin-dependent oxidoreductase [Lacticaseibacillus paracasei]MCZ2761855.1 LLM class flavin-dependent oxidoreductase [Lacticaseibacillus paracasei]
MVDIEHLQFGLETFGDIVANEDASLQTAAASIRQIVREGKLADDLGIDVFGVGEHHRPDYSVSSPETVLAAISAVTKQVKLATAVTVLSSDDPVRVYERFATLDALSNGRAQVMLGRGSFTESFPLFGYDLTDYDDLFNEKLGLYDALRNEKAVTWSGKFRAALKNQEVYPKTENGKLETYIGIGGSPESVIRAVNFGYKVIIAIIGGQASRFKPYIELYHAAAKELGKPEFPIAVHSDGFIADDEDEAVEVAFKNIKANFDRIGLTRGWAPMSREQFEGETKVGSFYVGDPETVARRMAATIDLLDLGRFDLVYGAGNQTAAQRERMIELYGTKVIPRVKEILAEKAAVK